MVLVAEKDNEVLSVGRLALTGAAGEAEFSLLVGDPWQGKGLGAAILGRLIEIAKREKLKRIVAELSHDNDAMKKMFERTGFQLSGEDAHRVLHAVLEIK